MNMNKNESQTENNSQEPDHEESNNQINSIFTIDEVKEHIRLLKQNKSPGVDHILNEFIKNCPEKLVYIIVFIFNIVLETGVVPSDWSTGIIKPIYKKKGNKNCVDNYRGITLLSCLGKLFTSVLNTRIYKYLVSENILGSEQVGFRPLHSTLDHILTLQILINYYLAQEPRGRPLYCAFVDYSKAFDFIDRTYLWQKLLNSNVNGKVLTVIKNMYHDAKSFVSVKNELSDSFPCQVGVRQGENLSPLLFALYINDLKNFLSEKYNGLNTISSSLVNELNVYLKLFCLLYADDTLVLAESPDELQKALNGLYMYCCKWKLSVNVDKTKVIIFSRGKKTKIKSFNFGDHFVEIVEEYVYLGTTFRYNGNFDKAIEKQVLQAKKATFSLITKTNQLNLSLEVFSELYDKLVIPVLLYGSEIWGYANLENIYILVNKTMRKMLKLNKSTPICMLHGELGWKDISEYVKNRMLNFWLKTATGEENKISYIMYNWIKTLYDKNIFKSKWLHNIKTTLDNIGMSNIFNRPNDLNKTWFKNTIKLRLSDIHNQRWSETVFNNGVCINYRVMTKHSKLKGYLTTLPKKYMYSMLKFKCANIKIPIVRGWYANMPVDERVCNLCQSNEIGDEFHYLFNCNFFDDHRKRFLKAYYYRCPNMYKMEKLFELEKGKDLLNLSKFIDIVVTHFKY